MSDQDAATESADALPVPVQSTSDDVLSDADSQFESLVYEGLGALETGDFARSIDAFEAALRAFSDLEEGAEDDRLVAYAGRSFAQGQANRTGRDPGAAVANFRTAAKAYAELHELTGAPHWRVLAENAQTLAYVAGGQEKLLRGDPSAAVSLFQRAKVAGETTLEETIPSLVEKTEDDDAKELLEEIRRALVVESTAYAMLFRLASYRDRTAKGALPAALEEIEAVCELIQLQIDQLPDDSAKWIRFGIVAELHSNEAQRDALRGQLATDGGRWDEAMAAYASARAAYHKAADAVLKTGLPGATASQEALLNQASAGVDLAIRQTERQRALSERIEALKGTVRARENDLESLRSVLVKQMANIGLTVNANSSADVDQKIDITAQIVQHVETSVRTVLADIARTTEHLELDPEAKRKIIDESEALLASDDHGPTFIDRAKRFTGDVAAIVTSAATAAAPLAPFVEKLASLVGR